MDYTTDIDFVIFALQKAAKASPGGISGVARRIGRPTVQLMNRLNPHDDSHHLILLDLQAVMDATGDTSALDDLCRMNGGRFVTRTEERADSVLAAVLKSDDKHGDIAHAIRAAYADNVLTTEERMAIRREIAEARHALDVLSNTLDEDLR